VAAVDHKLPRNSQGLIHVNKGIINYKIIIAVELL